MCGMLRNPNGPSTPSAGLKAHVTHEAFTCSRHRTCKPALATHEPPSKHQSHDQPDPLNARQHRLLQQEADVSNRCPPQTHVEPHVAYIFKDCSLAKLFWVVQCKFGRAYTFNPTTYPDPNTPALYRLLLIRIYRALG